MVQLQTFVDDRLGETGFKGFTSFTGTRNTRAVCQKTTRGANGTASRTSRPSPQAVPAVHHRDRKPCQPSITVTASRTKPNAGHRPSLTGQQPLLRLLRQAQPGQEAPSACCKALTSSRVKRPAAAERRLGDECALLRASSSRQRSSWPIRS